MVDALPKTCSKCGKKVLELGHHLKGSYRLSNPEDLNSEYTCEECYEKNWDKGFEASMDYSDKMMLKEKNEDFKKEDIDRKDVSFIVYNYGMGTWTCLKCGKVRLTPEETRTTAKEEKEKLIDTLMQPCPHCGARGKLHYLE